MTSMPPDGSRPPLPSGRSPMGRDTWGSWRAAAPLLLLISMAYLYVFPYFPTINNPNENVRLYMTRSIVDEGMMALGRREPGERGWDDLGPGLEEWGYVNDKALVCDDPHRAAPNCQGELHSAKAPGTSYLGVPVYAAVKAASGGHVDKTNAIYWLRLLVVVLPSIAMLWSFWAVARRFSDGPFAPAMALTGLALGSMSFTYSQMFAGHQLTAVCLWGGFAALLHAHQRIRGRRHAAYAWGGLFVAAAVLMEYPTAMPALALVAWALWMRPTLGELAAGIAGALPPAAGLMAFHHVAFGAVWRTPYSSLENPQFVADIAPGFLGIRGPTLEAFVGSFLAPFNGMWFFAPWTALVVVAAAWWIVRGRRKPAAGAAQPSDTAGPTPSVAAPMNAALGVVGLYTLFISSHSLWRGGWTLGPRYIVGIMPFVAFAVMVWLDRAHRRSPWWSAVFAGALVLASLVVTLACSLVSQGFPFSFYNPFVEVALPLLADGYVVSNFGNLLGLSGLATAVPLALIALGAWARSIGLARLPRAGRWSAGAAALGGTCLILALLSLPSSDWTEQKGKDWVWLRSVWRPTAQSPLVQRRDELEERARTQPTSITAPEWNELGQLWALDGKPTRAMRAYQDARLSSVKP